MRTLFQEESPQTTFGATQFKLVATIIASSHRRFSLVILWLTWRSPRSTEPRAWFRENLGMNLHYITMYSHACRLSRGDRERKIERGGRKKEGAAGKKERERGERRREKEREEKGGERKRERRKKEREKEKKEGEREKEGERGTV